MCQSHSLGGLDVDGPTTAVTLPVPYGVVVYVALSGEAVVVGVVAVVCSNRSAGRASATCRCGRSRRYRNYALRESE